VSRDVGEISTNDALFQEQAATAVAAAASPHSLSIIFVAATGYHHQNTKVVKKLSKVVESCQKLSKVVKKLSKSCQKVVKKLQKVVKKLSKSCQKVVKKLSKSC
jgi:vacuolar-type H+-ATPase catalytic subunit A/Vma1